MQKMLVYTSNFETQSLTDDCLVFKLEIILNEALHLQDTNDQLKRTGLRRRL